MKKKIVKLLLTTILFSFLSFVTVKIVSKVKQKAKIDERIEVLPFFTFQKADSKIVDKSMLSNNKPSIIVAFYPDCEHCQYEAKSIKENAEILKDVNIIMVTPLLDSLALVVFTKQFGLDSLSNVYVTRDFKSMLNDSFGIKKMPTVLIYGAKNNLMKRYNGETKIETILKILDLPHN